MDHQCKQTKVLVFPRTVFGSAFSLLPWESIQSNLDEIERTFLTWMHRPEAERSEKMVQAIPCTIIRDSADSYCVFRRVKEGRSDLRGKLSLIIGGHIDTADDQDCFLTAMSRNLIREVKEEIGVRLAEPPRPVGVIIDGSSIVASRHIAFLHEMIAERVSTQAPEEFQQQAVEVHRKSSCLHLSLENGATNSIRGHGSSLKSMPARPAFSPNPVKVHFSSVRRQCSYRCLPGHLRHVANSKLLRSPS